jgi:hypothetical protein
MLDAAQPLPQMSGVFVLSDVDMVLHSAVHLMHEGELEMGLRGLVDIDALVTEFAHTTPDFWVRLSTRALELDLQRPAFLAMRYAQRMLGSETPQTCLECLHEASSRLGPQRLAWLDELYDRGLRPAHHSLDDRFSGLARFVLYVRSHWLRMPPHLLVPHLLRKAGTRMMDGFKTKDGTDHAQA